MAHFVSAADMEKLEDLKKARQCAEHLSQYRTKYSVVPKIDPEELLELYVAIERLEGGPTVYGFKSDGTEPQTKTESCPRCGEQDYLLNLCGKCVQALVRNADSLKTEATAKPTETKTKGDAAADKIISAFEGEECLTDADLLKASGLSRKEYIQVRDFLIYDTCELNEMAEEDGSTVYEYAKPRKQNAAA